MKKFFPQSVKNIYHFSTAVIANLAFGFPSRKIKVIGVTGTNGKTTTVQMIAKILESSGIKLAMSSTINYKIGEKEWVNKTKYTTESSWQVQKFLAKAVQEGCQYVILETSSHALDQGRVWGTDYDVAVVTNVTREHLDYHHTMQKYRNAKELLFSMLSRNITRSLFPKQTKKTVVVNLEMERPEDFLRYTADQKFGYTVAMQNEKSEKQAHEAVCKVIEAQAVELGVDKTKFSVMNEYFELNLIGQFNIENSLAAISVGISQGISLDKMKEALGKIAKVPGRMDRVENSRGLTIIIDYALTPDSMEKLCTLLGQLKGGGSSKRKLFWVFGSCGDRDRGKRPIMGAIVAKAADYVFVTNEDPYNEDPQQIIDEVFKGVVEGKKKEEGKNAWKIMDRKEAIKKAITMADNGDIVLVTGKGAEEIMAVGDKRIPWNDRNVIEDILAELSGSVS